MKTPIILFRIPEYGDFIVQDRATNDALYYRWDSNDLKKKKLWSADIDGINTNTWAEISKEDAFEIRKKVRDNIDIRCMVLRDIDPKDVGDLVIDGLPFMV